MRRLLARSAVALVAIVSLMGFGSLVQSLGRPVVTKTVAAGIAGMNDHDHANHSLSDIRVRTVGSIEGPWFFGPLRR